MLLHFLGSSTAQQCLAQPREVRKEATVGTVQCVTQDYLTLFYFISMEENRCVFVVSDWLERRTPKYFLTITLTLFIVMMARVFNLVNRCGSMRLRVCLNEKGISQMETFHIVLPLTITIVVKQD